MFNVTKASKENIEELAFIFVKYQIFYVIVPDSKKNLNFLRDIIKIKQYSILPICRKI